MKRATVPVRPCASCFNPKCECRCETCQARTKPAYARQPNPMRGIKYDAANKANEKPQSGRE